MYKAGDFTNGKMNEIFKTCFKAGESSSYDSGVKIEHKQLGGFYLVSESGLLLPTIIMLGGVHGFNDYAESHMKDHNELLKSDDPSRFFSVAAYIGGCSVIRLLKIVNGFFNIDCEDDFKCDFSNLFCLLNYLVCEKGCTYSGTVGS